MASSNHTSSVSHTLMSTDIHVIADGLLGPQGPTVLPDGTIVFVAQGSDGCISGGVFSVSPQGYREILLTSMVGVHGTAYDPRLGVLYVPKFDVLTSPLKSILGPNVSSANAALGAAVLKVDLQSKVTAPIFASGTGSRLKGPATIIVDEWGDIWMTDGFHDDGSLVWGAHDGSYVRQITPCLPGANGLGLSPDGRTIYLTSRGKLFALDIVDRGQVIMDGEIPRVRTVAALDPDLQPDGIATDPDGNIIVCARENGILVISPRGIVMSHVRLANLLVSNFAFDPSAGCAYLTVSPIDQPREMQGKLVSIQWPCQNAYRSGYE